MVIVVVVVVLLTTTCTTVQSWRTRDCHEWHQHSGNEKKNENQHCRQGVRGSSPHLLTRVGPQPKAVREMLGEKWFLKQKSLNTYGNEKREFEHFQDLKKKLCAGSGTHL